MLNRISCPVCRVGLKVDDPSGSSVTECPNCGSVFNLADWPEDRIKPWSDSEEHVRISCPFCRASLLTEKVRQRIQCAQCSRTFIPDWDKIEYEHVTAPPVSTEFNKDKDYAKEFIPYRRLQAVAAISLAVMAAFFAFSFVLDNSQFIRFGNFALFLFVVTNLVAGFWKCPRCKRHFSSKYHSLDHALLKRGGGYLGAFAPKCVYCGLPLDRRLPLWASPDEYKYSPPYRRK